MEKEKLEIKIASSKCETCVTKPCQIEMCIRDSYGIARELSAIYNVPLKELPVAKIDPKDVYKRQPLFHYRFFYF